VFIAIEVKRSKNVYSKDIRALKAFRQDYPESKVAILYMGKDSVVINGIHCIPLEKFLKNLNPNSSLI
jgi:hypothetical protein